MDRKTILTVTLNPAVDYSVKVPGFKVDYVNRASGGRRDPGGKGINVATVTARYGIETAVTGFLGVQNSGIFREHFRKLALRDEFIYIEGSTREGIKITDSENMITTDINFDGQEVDDEKSGLFVENYTRLCKGYDYVVLSGSLPAGLPSGFYADLARIAKGAGAFTAVDTSGEALRLAVESGCIDLIKPNERELADAFGSTDAQELLSRVGMVVLSLGEKGSILYTRGGTWAATAPVVNAVTTVGAGDSLLAGFTAGLIFGQKPDDALKFASATAASKMMKYGPGLAEDFPPGSFYENITVSRRS